MLEDFSGNHEFAMFGEEYLKLKPYLDLNVMLVFKGFVNRYTPSWEGAQMRVEPKIKEVILLQDAMEQLCNSVSITIALDDVIPDNIELVNDLVENNKGNKRINFLIFDPEKPKVHIKMPSRNNGVEVNKGFLDALKEHSFLKMQLN